VLSAGISFRHFLLAFTALLWVGGACGRVHGFVSSDCLLLMVVFLNPKDVGFLAYFLHHQAFLQNAHHRCAATRRCHKLMLWELFIVVDVAKMKWP